jgi:hypothetical protein
MFNAVLEVCILTYLEFCECKFVTIFLFCNFFRFCLTVNMSISGFDTQDFRPALRPKQKGNHFIHPTGTAHPSHPQTSLLFCQKVSQKLTVFHLNQTVVSPGSHLLSSTVLLTSIPLLSRKQKASYPSRREVKITKTPTTCI